MDGGAPVSKHMQQMGQQDSEADGRHKRHVVSNLVVLILSAIAAGILLWPRILNAQSQSEMDESISEIRALGDSDSRTEEQSHKVDAAWNYLHDYNEQVREGLITDINDPWGFDADQEGFPATELPDGIVGEVRIPVMDVDLPLYLGSTEENMYKGATVMYGSSAPLGEMDSNCVIAAHRGYTNGYMFNYIERLQVGDHVYVTTPWATLDYQVTSFKVVTPDDTESVKVQQGRDMVTLLTCHPHPQHTHRLLVYCDRVGTIPNDIASASGASGTDDVQLTVPKTEDEITIFGMDVLEFQNVATNVGLAASALFAGLSIFNLIRMKRNRTKSVR